MSNPSLNEQNHREHSDQSVESINDSDSDPSYAVTPADKRDERLDLEDESAVVYTTKTRRVSFRILSFVLHIKYIHSFIIKEHKNSFLQVNQNFNLFCAILFVLLESWVSKAATK